MYKVFANEKLLSINNNPSNAEKNLLFENNISCFDIAIDLLFNTSALSVNIYHHRPDMVWDLFYQYMKIIIAAGGIVENPKDEILLIHRLNRWDLPKGKLEKGETIEQCAVREVEEECSLTGVKLDSFIKPTYHIYLDHKTYVLKETHWYLMHVDIIETPKPQLEEGITAVEWKNKKEARELLLKSYENIKMLTLSYLDK